MANDTIFVEIIQFAPTKQCSIDPFLFKAVRDIVAERWQEKGLKDQYWGTAVEKPRNIYWVLLWESRAHAAAFAADPSYAEVVQRRQSLTINPVRDIHAALCGTPPQLCLESPITEVGTYKALDTHSEEVHEVGLSVMHDIASLQPAGYNGCSIGVMDEDSTVGVYFCGWDSIEDHMRLGMEEGHEKVRETCEKTTLVLCDITITHVFFKKHGA